MTIVDDVFEDVLGNRVKRPILSLRILIAFGMFAIAVTVLLQFRKGGVEINRNLPALRSTALT